MLKYYLVRFVKDNFTNVNIITDKRVYDGCSKRRPDIFIDMGYQIIIVEIDENQHTNYDCSCENRRLMELSQDVNHRPIVFIRFNPDNYKKNNKTIPTCWCINKDGVCIVNKKKNGMKDLEH